jgi:hypothetical protein
MLGLFHNLCKYLYHCFSCIDKTKNIILNFETSDVSNYGIVKGSRGLQSYFFYAKIPQLLHFSPNFESSEAQHVSEPILCQAAI